MKCQSLFSGNNKKSIITLLCAECVHTVVNCCLYITKTCLYNIDPLKPHFYIVKLGFTGVCILSLISTKK